MNITKQELESRIANYIGRKHCLLVGRGTTAIYLAIKSFQFTDGNIIIPSIVCPNPVFPVLYCNMTPQFCDINLDDFTIDIESFKESVNDETRAVIPVNLYGYPANYKELIPICKKRNIKIIEDAAQSFGGFYNGKRLGSFGDISVISFGHTKIINVESGGAILTDDSELFEQIKLEYEKLKEKPKDLKIKGELYREVYYTLQPLWQKHNDLYYLYSSFPIIFKSIYLYKFPETIISSLGQELKEIDQNVSARKKNAEFYLRHLSENPKIKLPEYNDDNGVYWRICFLIEGDNQLNISNNLRKKGIDVSNWYPSIHKMFLPKGQYDPSNFKNSNYLEKHIFNLWVHPRITKEKIEKTCNILNEILKNN